MMSEIILNFPSPDSPASQPRLGEDLVQRDLITYDQLEVALHEKSRTGRMLGTILVDLKIISHKQLNEVLAERAGHILFDPQNTMIDPEISLKIPRQVAEQHHMIPLSTADDGIMLGMVDPFDVFAMDAAQSYFVDEVIIPVLITTHDLSDLIDGIYHHKFDLMHLLRDLRHGQSKASYNSTDIANLRNHPVIRLINALLLHAVRNGASDLHFEPEQHLVRIRLRIDGYLQHLATIHNDFWSAIAHRLKIMAGMNIANRLMPQDGRFTLSVLGRSIDFRAASLPGLYGENISIRVLDSTRELLDIATLGFSTKQLKEIKSLLARPEGLIVITGPTGSGKTTTLYAMLQQLADVSRNIMTLEDPIEYQLPTLRQTQIREQTGLTFAEGVRAILRQDPDVILIGEIRDSETAQMALRAAMTGHLVFTTLHTRDVFGVVPRLLDLGITPNVLNANLNAVVAQRLVRCLCQACCETYDPVHNDEIAISNGNKLHRAKGCQDCNGTGYKGRTIAGELFQFDSTMPSSLFTQPDRAEWRQVAKKGQQASLIEMAHEKLLSGIIDYVEFNRLRDMGFTDA